MIATVFQILSTTKNRLQYLRHRFCKLLGFWTFRNSKYQKTQCVRNWICFRPHMKRARRIICRIP
jgi:hypothetical protein